MNTTIIVTALIVVALTGTQGWPWPDLAKLLNINDAECPAGGYKPHENCNLYYQCVHERWLERSCNPVLYWKQEITGCAYRHEVPECVGGTRPPSGPTEPPTPPSTTKAPEEVTTVAPEVTTAAPPVTTVAPEVTTVAPEVTTDAPEVTTEAEEVTTVAPEVTTEAEEVTTEENEPETTPGPINPCAPEGFYTLPIEGSCVDYIHCVFGVAIPLTCADGLEYDHSIGKCNKEELVNCSIPTDPPTEEPTTEESETEEPTTEESETEEPTTEESETEEPTTEEATTEDSPLPICLEDGIYFVPYEGNCSLYYICANPEEPKVESCYQTLTFDPVALKCVREENSSCVNPTVPPTTPEPSTTEIPITTTSPATSNTETPAPIRCENEGVYYIPSPESDCTEYYLCAFYIPYIQYCAPGTLFSEELETCVREEDYVCPGQEQDSSTTEDGPNSPVTDIPDDPSTTVLPTTTVVPSTTVVPTTPEPTTTGGVDLFPCPPTGFHYLPHPNSCNEFYICGNGDLTGIFSCGEEYWFHSVSQSCVLPADSDCELESSDLVSLS